MFLCSWERLRAQALESGRLGPSQPSHYWLCIFKMGSLTALSLSFLFCKMGITILHTGDGCGED